MAGQSSRSVQYRKPAAQAYVDLMRAFQQVGKVESASEATLSVRGQTSYGFQSVRLRVSIIEKDENNSLLEIQAAGDDVWAGGARAGTDRLIEALENLDSRAGAKEGAAGKRSGGFSAWRLVLLFPLLWIIGFLIAISCR